VKNLGWVGVEVFMGYEAFFGGVSGMSGVGNWKLIIRSSQAQKILAGCSMLDMESPQTEVKISVCSD
jgi:hypothetical protein